MMIEKFFKCKLDSATEQENNKKPLRTEAEVEVVIYLRTDNQKLIL